MNEQTLEELILQAGAGKAAAQNELVRRFQDMAIGYAYALLADFHLAQDCAQEAFLEAFACMAGLRQPEAFPGWFRRIVFKQCDRVRRQGGKKEVLRRWAEMAAPPAQKPDDLLEENHLRQMLNRALRALPERERAAVSLFYVSGCPQKEIAAFLDMPLPQVKYRLHAARKRLQEQLRFLVHPSARPAEADFAGALMQRRRKRMQQTCSCPLCGAEVEYEIADDRSVVPPTAADPHAYLIRCRDVCRDYIILGRQEEALNPLPPERRLLLSEYTRCVQENNCIITLYADRIQDILNAYDVAVLAAGQYGLEGARINFAWSNHLILTLSAEGRRYTLLLFRPEGPQQEIRSQTLWLQDMRRHADLYVPEPVQAPDGTYFQQVYLEHLGMRRHCALYVHQPGVPLEAIPAEERSAALYKRAGRFLAQTHNHAESFSAPDGFYVQDTHPYEARQDLNAVERYAAEKLKGADDASARDALRDLSHTMRVLGEAKQYFGLINLYGENTLLVDGERIGVRHVTQWHWGYYLADIARFIDCYSLSSEADRAALLTGYAAVRPLADGALEHMAVFSRGRAYMPWL